MTSFKKEIKEPKKLHKVFEHFKLFVLCSKTGKKLPKKYYIIFWLLFLFLNDVIRNVLHDNIGFVLQVK